MFNFFCFCFKQKTAYEMRISDWSSDVCSSDLPGDFSSLKAGRALNAPGIAPIAHLCNGGDQVGNSEGACDGGGNELIGCRHDGAQIAIGHVTVNQRSEERRVGKEWGSTCSSRWSPYN